MRLVVRFACITPWLWTLMTQRSMLFHDVFRVAVILISIGFNRIGGRLLTHPPPPKKNQVDSSTQASVGKVLSGCKILRVYLFSTLVTSSKRSGKTIFQCGELDSGNNAILTFILLLFHSVALNSLSQKGFDLIHVIWVYSGTTEPIGPPKALHGCNSGGLGALHTLRIDTSNVMTSGRGR